MGTAFLVRPGGRSESPHPPRPAIKSPAASARTSRPGREIARLESNIGHPAEPGVGPILIRDDFSPGAGAQSFVDLIIHLVAQVADVAVAVQKERAAAMTAEELVDVTARITWAMAFAGMAQDHARSVLANTSTPVRVKGVWRTRPERGAGDCACPCGLSPSQVKVCRPFTHAQGLGQAVGDVGELRDASAVKRAVTIDTGFADPKNSNIVRSGYIADGVGHGIDLAHEDPHFAITRCPTSRHRIGGT